MTPFADRAVAYAERVTSGEVVACKQAIAACRRLLSDFKRQGDSDFPYIWNPSLQTDEDTPYFPAERVCQFVERMHHVKGKWARKGLTISLEDWQCFVLCTTFGWVHAKTKLRRFRTVYVEIPRKNAKTTLSSAIGLYTLLADNEAGSEVYSAATSAEQACICWGIAQRMVRQNLPMQQRFGVDARAHNILKESDGSIFKYLSSDTKSLDGLNTHCVIIDELHAHKNREVFDVMETSTGSREQPLVFIITTAGSNKTGICYEQRSYVDKLLGGVVQDETYFGIIYTIDEGDDWTDPAVWEKANPNFNVSVSPDDLERKAVKAMAMPSAQNNFLTKHLNLWVNADTAWLNMRDLEKCINRELRVEDFTGEPCIAAADLATKIDIASVAKIFTKTVNGQTHYYAFLRNYLPEDTVFESDNAMYSGWAKQGYLIETDGNVIDFTMLEDDLLRDAAEFKLEELAIDPFQAQQFSNNMLAHGMNVVEVRATVQNFSEPMKELEALIRSGRFHYDGDPVLTWMFSNVVCHQDVKENIYPRKERASNKIDGVVALIMALNRTLSVRMDESCVYEVRGVRSL
jgi:phage terminase large subunit-like protein